MATYTVEDQPDLTIPEDTIVRARLTELKERELEWKDKQTGEDKSTTLLQWWFEVTSGTYEGRKVKGECEAKLSNHPRNKFRAWAEALLDMEEGALEVGKGVDTEDLVGLSADISIRHRPDKQDAKKIWEEVDEVMRITSMSTPGAPDDVPF